METSTSSTNATKPKRKRLLLIGGAAIMLTVAWALIAAAGGDDGADSTMPIASVTRGELVVLVAEKGEIEANKKTTISNNLHWNVVIVERVDEGTHVEEGDLIIRFECKELLDAIDRAKLDLTAAENEFQKANEDISLSEKEWRHKIAQAHAAQENAVNNLRKFEQHEQNQQLQEAQSELALAEQDLELSDGKLQFMLKVNNAPGLEETYSASTVKAEQLSVDRLKLKVATAKAEVEKLTKYEHPRELRRLQLEVDDVELELERVESEAKAQSRLAAVNLATKKSQLEMQTRKLEDLLEQKEKLVQRAEAPGIILYDSGRWWETPDLSVGAIVRSRQRLMQIPDMSSLVVSSRVFEGVSEKVQLDMAATIRLDSRPGDVYGGKVSKIAQIASSQDHRNSPNVKVFPIQIELDHIPADLKPGSTAQIELVLARLPDVLIVPIASVQTEQELTYCWRLIDGKPVTTFIEIGQVSETHVEVVSGLAEGDIVLLAPPADASPQINRPKDAKPKQPTRAEPEIASANAAPKASPEPTAEADQHRASQRPADQGERRRKGDGGEGKARTPRAGGTGKR